MEHSTKDIHQIIRKGLKNIIWAYRLTRLPNCRGRCFMLSLIIAKTKLLSGKENLKDVTHVIICGYQNRILILSRTDKCGFVSSVLVWDETRPSSPQNWNPLVENERVFVFSKTFSKTFRDQLDQFQNLGARDKVNFLGQNIR